MEVQKLVVERRIKSLERMEAECLEADLRQEAKLWQEAYLRQEANLRRPEVETTEEGAVSMTGVLEEEEEQYKDDEEEGDEGLTTYVEDIDVHEEDEERDNGISVGDEDVDWDPVRGVGGFEAEKLESGRSY